MEEFSKISLNDEVIDLNSLSVDELNEKMMNLTEEKRKLQNEIDDILKLYI